MCGVKEVKEQDFIYVESEQKRELPRKMVEEDQPRLTSFPGIRLGNTHVSVNTPENDPGRGRINSTTQCRQEATRKRTGRVETWLGPKRTCGTVCGRDVSRRDVSLWAQGGDRNRLPHAGSLHGEDESSNMWL